MSGSGAVGDGAPADVPVAPSGDATPAPQLTEKERRRLAYAAQPQKPKAKLTKAERRARQEKERAAKAAAKTSAQPDKRQGRRKASSKGLDDERAGSGHPPRRPFAKGQKGQMVPRTQSQKQVGFFSHLPQHERESSLSLNVQFSSSEAVHPSILALGLKFGDGVVCSANARAIAMLVSFKEFISDYRTPPNKVLFLDLDRQLKKMIQFLIDCRPKSLTMSNAIKHVRGALTMLGQMQGRTQIAEEDAKAYLCETIDDYIRSQITVAQSEIVKLALTKIVDGDVILTYARSHVVEEILLAAHREQRSFKVVVVGSRPGDEGRGLLRCLAEAGIRCVYVLLPAVSHVMDRVTKVFLGAGALLCNGTVLSRAGTAAVALVASAYNRPVMVCAETYKFSERVLLDSICYNELGDPDELLLPSSFYADQRQGLREPLADWRDIPQLKLLNLTYDVTPAEHVDVVITELGMIPPTSVPVIIRERHDDSVRADRISAR